MMQAGHGGRFEEIDVLRGLAALTVMFSHYVSYVMRYLVPGATGAGSGSVETVAHAGFYAVQLFFLISGFVISFTLERTRKWYEFALLRATRLYPTYWAALTLMVVLEVVVFNYRISPSGSTAIWWRGFVINLTMLQEFFGIGNFDNVFWSLTVEVAFYVDMAILFRAGLLRNIELTVAVWLGGAALAVLLEQWAGIVLPGLLSAALVLPYVPFFAGGILLYRINSRGVTPLRVALIGAALAEETLIHGSTAGWVALLLFGVGIAAVSGWLRFLVSPLTLWLGSISYSLYLVHHNLGYSTLLVLHEAGAPDWLAIAITAAAALLLAAAMFYAVERPALRLARQWRRGTGWRWRAPA